MSNAMTSDGNTWISIAIAIYYNSNSNSNLTIETPACGADTPDPRAPRDAYNAGLQLQPLLIVGTNYEVPKGEDTV